MPSAKIVCPVSNKSGNKIQTNLIETTEKNYVRFKFNKEELSQVNFKLKLVHELKKFKWI